MPVHHTLMMSAHVPEYEAIPRWEGALQPVWVVSSVKVPNDSFKAMLAKGDPYISSMVV